MFLTVTANSALDHVFFIDEFIPGTMMRPQRVVESVGGKGLDASVAFRALGLDTLAIGFMAGETGKALARLVDCYGIRQELVWVEGETRTAHVIVERTHRRHSHLVAAGYCVQPADCERLFDLFRKRIGEAEWVVAGGSLPQGAPADFYATLTAIARESDVPILVDCPGEPALQAMAAGPAVLKMNEQEFCQTFDAQARSPEDLKRAAVDARERSEVGALVVTCGERGILAVTSQGCYQAAAPCQAVVSAAGAGDATSASLAWRLSVGDSWPEALRWAAATGAAAVLTEGTADCRLEDVKRIYADVDVRAV